MERPAGRIFRLKRAHALFLFAFVVPAGKETTTNRTQTKAPAREKTTRKHKKIKKLKMLELRAPRVSVVLMGAGRKKY